MTTSSQSLASASGTFALGGDLPVHRLGYGTMQLTGPGVWGDPADPAEAVRVLRRAVELGVTLIDTADSYGPYVTDALIREALHPYPDDLVIATKVGFTRQGPGQWVPVGRPEFLRQEVELNLRHLGVERIDLLQLHRIDPKVSARGSDRRARRPAVRGQDPAHRPVRGQRRADRRGPEDRPDRLRAEPLQPGGPGGRRRAGLRRDARTSPSFRGSRWPPASSRPPAARWPSWPSSMTPPHPSSRWPGCCTAHR